MINLHMFQPIMGRRDDPTSPQEVSLRCYLLRLGFEKTQREMGELAGVSGNAWQNYEKGTRRPGLDAAMGLENSISLPQEWLYRGVVLRLPDDIKFRLEKAIRALEAERRAKKRS